MSTSTSISYLAGETELTGHIALPDADGPRPCVLVVHAFMGLAEFERKKAAALADLGYVGFAVDYYGKGRVAKDRGEAGAWMGELEPNRAELRRRLRAGLEVARGLDAVDGRVAAIGFCFGGLGVLELARSGADVAGVVSFHGILHTDRPAQRGGVSAKVLVCHGWEDPLAPPEQLRAFADEMTAAGVDWQAHAYGDTAHAFTNPRAKARDAGLQYSPRADRRSWQAMRAFLDEVFEDA